MHGIADTCNPPGLHIVLSAIALRYQAHAFSFFRVETLVRLDQSELRHNPQENKFYTESLHIEPMTSPTATKINTKSKSTNKTSKHVVVFSDLRQLVSVGGGVCDVSHTDVMI